MRPADESRPSRAASADNRPGLPDDLKSAVETLSGMSLDDVKVHHDSPRPAQLDALAYTQGTDIHLGPGQDRHLAHEAWHVVQQAKGRVKPTMQMKGGVKVNDQQALEHEADVMGAAATRRAAESQGRRAAEPAKARPLANTRTRPLASPSSQSPLQRYKIDGAERTISDAQMDEFDRKRKEERDREATGRGFAMRADAPGRNPGPVKRGAMGLARSRFDITGVESRHQGSVERAIAGGTGSPALNDVSMQVGMNLFGRMLRNVGRLKHDNWVRDLANMSGSPYSKPFKPGADPTRAIGAESATLRMSTNVARAPHYNPEENSVSLMMPEQVDQTGHELQHALDHLSGGLDLSVPSHRLASEQNAFTRQDSIAREETGRSPTNFERRSPEQMARSYERKEGYPGTLDESQKAVKAWRASKDKEK